MSRANFLLGYSSSNQRYFSRYTRIVPERKFWPTRRLGAGVEIMRSATGRRRRRSTETDDVGATPPVDLQVQRRFNDPPLNSLRVP